MLKDMFIFALRNIKSYKKFFIHIVIILSLILCLCSIYICSITSIYDSYDNLQNMNLQYNYVEINKDVPFMIIDKPTQTNDLWMKYDFEISKRTKYYHNNIGVQNFKHITSNYTLLVDNKEYKSNLSTESIFYVEGTNINYSLYTKNEETAFKSEFGNKSNILLSGDVIKDNNDIILNESVVSLYNLNVDDIVGKEIKFINNDYQTSYFKVVGVISKDYTDTSIFMSDKNDYFSVNQKHYKTITRVYFTDYYEGEKAFDQFFNKYNTDIVTYAAEDLSSSIATLQNMLTFIQIIFIIFMVILGGSFLVTLALKVDSIIYLQKTFLGVLISHGFERRKVDMLLWAQVIICGLISSIFSAIVGTIFVIFSKSLFEGLGVNVVLNFGTFITSLGIIFVLMIAILFIICAPMFIKLRKNDIIDYLR